MSKNDITGDNIRSKILSAEGRENWDRIFKKQPTSHCPVCGESWEPGKIVHTCKLEPADQK